MSGDVDLQAGKVPLERSQRRQNTSCDHCRRSKRRCVLPSRGRGEPELERIVICTYCQRHGHPCTFNFVKSRAGARPRQTRRQIASSPQAVSDHTALGRTPDDPSHSGGDSIAMSTNEISIPWMDFDLDDFLDESVFLPSSTGFVSTMVNSQGEGTTAQQNTRDSRSDQVSVITRSTPTRHSRLASIAGSSVNSPMRLLNAKVNTQVLDEHLAKIYETIVTGSASRFMDHKCNLYATGRPYKLEYEESQDSEHPLYSIPRALSPDTISNTPSLDLQSRKQLGDSQMTVLGAVRFLDHFADLYGNRMDLATRRQSDAVLKAVLRAFALQWLPASPSPWPVGGRSNLSYNMCVESLGERDALQDVFTEAWVQARRVLSEAKSITSFRVVCSMILFDGIAVPAQVSSGIADSIVPHEFLDTGLEKLSYLDGLVKQYCDNLGPSAKYGSLLETSLSIIRWGGYVRDTGAALTSNRECKLPDLLSSMPAFPEDHSDQGSSPAHDANVPRICRAAFSSAFGVWRQILDIKTAQETCKVSPQTVGSIRSATTAIGNFDRWFRPFMTHCLDNFINLSMNSRIFLVSFCMVWDLGVFVLAKAVKPVIAELRGCGQSTLAANVETHRRDAIISVARTVEQVLTLTTDVSFNLQNGLSAETPIFAYHITPGLMVASLENAIEQIIDLQFSSHREDGRLEGDIQDPTPDGPWEQQIDFLMKALLSLDVTIGGSGMTSMTIQSLMRKHGDVLSECWTCDFDS